MKRKISTFEPLNKENDFNLVFKKGKTIKLKNSLVRATYLFCTDNSKKNTMMAITISSKLGNSVWRNRFKRLIKEAALLEKNILSEILIRKKASLLLVFSPHRTNQKSNKKIFLEEIRSNVKDILQIIFQQSAENDLTDNRIITG